MLSFLLSEAEHEQGARSEAEHSQNLRFCAQAPRPSPNFAPRSSKVLASRAKLLLDPEGASTHKSEEFMRATRLQPKRFSLLTGRTNLRFVRGWSVRSSDISKFALVRVLAPFEGQNTGLLRTKAELLLAFECSCSASLPRGARPGPLLSFAEQGAWSKKLSKSKTLRQLQNRRFCKSFACEQNRRFCYP